MSGARILVIRLSSIGDIVLTTPVVRALRTQLEGETEIHFFTKKAFAPLLQANPYIDHIHLLGDSLTASLNELEKYSFDYVIDLHKNYRTSLTKKRLKTLNFTVEKLNWQKWLLVNTRIDLIGENHIVKRYMDTLKAFGVKDDGQGLDYFIPENEMVNPSDFGVQGKYLAIAVGGTHIGKVMPTPMIRQVAKSLAFPVVLLGHEEDGERMKIWSDNYPHVHNLCGKLSINQSASMVAQAEVVLSGDTGLMHIAAAFHKKIVSVWGCTSPKLGMEPYRANPDSIILEPLGRKRRPCSKLGNRCKYGKSNRCITDISSERISEAVNGLMAN